MFRKVSKYFSKDEQSEISLNGTVNDFLVEHNSIKKEETFVIYIYLMVRNNKKQSLGFLKKVYWTSTSDTSNHIRCVSLNNQKCIMQPALTNLHPNKFLLSASG